MFWTKTKLCLKDSITSTFIKDFTKIIFVLYIKVVTFVNVLHFDITLKDREKIRKKRKDLTRNLLFKYLINYSIIKNITKIISLDIIISKKLMFKFI